MFTKKHSKLTKVAVKASAVAVAALFGANVYAAGAVTVQGSFAWSAGDNVLDAPGSITAASFTSPNSYTDNPNLNNSAWGHAGTWYTFENQLGGSDVTVTVNGSATLAPGFTVWATNGVFDGGTGSSEVPVGTTGVSGTPHAFNATGSIGDFGTGWMSGSLGNATTTLGYAVSNPSINVASGAWGETVLAGANAVDGILASGSTSANSGSLTFDNLAAGWYAVYVGGTDSSTAGGGFDLVVSAVPEAETWAMLLAGLGLIGWRLRNQPRRELNMVPA
ncbi:MAG: PEP-CTERM sorting domain-containing protein [Nitrosomonas sp.]|nr:PEP-CTERM sorting domain-containing protein [Nitrosomonas sp.]